MMSEIDGKSPIGIFDSGIGGLTVAKAIMARLPRENIIYVGDTARVPYGTRSFATITRYALEITGFLISRRVKLLVIACNSIAAVALPAISAATTLPLVDVIEAGVSRALEVTKNGRIGIIGTRATINSQAYHRAIQERNKTVKVFSRACPLFVPLVEEGWLEKEATRLIAREYLVPLFRENIDTLILGCTHYPLLKPLLQEIAGPTINLIDSGDCVAKRAYESLEKLDILNCTGEGPNHLYCVTDGPEQFQRLGEAFLGQKIASIRLISLTGE